MLLNTIKNIVFAFGNYIDNKLKTKEGRLTLIILASLLTGASLVYAAVKNENYVDKIIEYNNLKKEKDSIEVVYSHHIANMDNLCNEKIKQGALLHQQLQAIYFNKTIENKETVEIQAILEKEKKEIIAVQTNNIKQLKKLQQN